MTGTLAIIISLSIEKTMRRSLEESSSLVVISSKYLPQKAKSNHLPMSMSSCWHRVIVYRCLKATRVEALGDNGARCCRYNSTILLLLTCKYEWKVRWNLASVTIKSIGKPCNHWFPGVRLRLFSLVWFVVMVTSCHRIFNRRFHDTQ